MFQKTAVFLLILLAAQAAVLAQKTEPADHPATQAVDRKDDWWTQRHAEKLKLVGDSRDFQLVFIGDSITHSWENGGKATWDKYYGHRQALNLGYSGDRTEHVIWRLQNGEIDGLNPKLVVLMIGTNNAGHRQDASVHTAAGIKMILDELDQRLPETKVLLLGIFPRDAGPGDELRKLNVATNEIIRSYADDDRVTFLDVSAAYLDDAGQLSKDLMPDLLHPNPEGYKIWAAAMEPTVAKLLGDQAVQP